MHNNVFKSATILALGAAGISGFSNFINKIAVSGVGDPIFYTSLKNAIVAVLFIGVLMIFRKWREIKGLRAGQWGRLMAIGIIGGSLPFALYFTGLSMIPAINAALIHKSLFLWVLILAVPLLKERLSWQQVAGVAAIFIANILVGGFKGFQFSFGELLVLAATILWAVENVIAKKTLEDVSATTVAAARMVFGSIILLAVIWLRGTHLAAAGDLSPAQWGWTLLSSVLLFGYVVTWYAALQRAPVTYVVALLVPATLVTNVLSAIFITHAFGAQQITGSVLFVAGTILMIFFVRKFTPPYLETTVIERG